MAPFLCLIITVPNLSPQIHKHMGDVFKACEVFKTLEV